MKKVILTTALFSALLIGTSAVTAHAAVTDDTHGTSTAKIGLEQPNPEDSDNHGTDPIDPDGDPNTNDPTGNKGALRIDYVSNIDFGTQKISSETKTYAAVQPAEIVESQVSDLRGSGAGWNLQVSYDAEKAGFFAQNGAELAGAELTLPAGNAKSTAGNQSAAATTSEVVVNKDAQNIMIAAEKAGLGTWADQMNAQAVALKVPSGNLSGEYSATLVWTLTDAPA